MVCIYCFGETKVNNSRPQKRGNQVWRRRQCLDCKAIFTSVETADLSSALAVKKQHKHLEPFSRDKLLISLYGSLKHRKSAIKDARGLTDTIISQLLASAQAGSLNSKDIQEVVHRTLKRFDGPAAVHYQAFHQG